MKVVVADDEQRVCALICALIDWDRLGLELCGTAYDGISALALIEQVRADLVITDIRMPGLDGLELIKKAKEANPSLQFIIISGHKQFDYAQTAIKYGVAEYLLKPIKQHELEQTLLKMLARHHEQQTLLENSQQLQQKLLQDRKQNRQLTFNLLLQDKRTDLLDTCFVRSTAMRILTVKLDLLKGFHAPEADLILTSKVGEFLGRECSHICCDSFSAYFEGSIYLWVSYAQNQADLFLKQTDSLLQFLKTQAEIYGNILFTLGVGVEVSSFADVPSSLLSSKQAVAERLAHGPLGRYIANHVEPLSDSNLVQPFVEDLQRSFAQNSPELLASQCREFLSRLEDLQLSAYSLQSTIMDCFSESSAYVLSLLGSDENCEKPILGMRQQLENAHSHHLLQQAFQESLAKLLQLCMQEKEESLSKPVRKAQEYLAQHFHDELISLESVSEVVNLNSSYFSALFKKSCNQGFFEYLVNLRIAEAKKLLANSTYSISEIAQRVGYRDPKHFSRVFKKACQIKPNEYRKLYG
ncbi:response regulator [Sphaerochaeta sp. PS]|uniref:response regulator transcription factor n=1 Tax=Sphaerochaeta sp. PS TaxID=3076336 RepID=UPI0028A42AFB|nr:response regulator [Sphaerochaeta sp. PS]MDT4761508.1 response regulator [Sphaerochaeta sp. PS]